jgi:photosystem II stability/assembly factor-like uncharacterized protein
MHRSLCSALCLAAILPAGAAPARKPAVPTSTPPAAPAAPALSVPAVAALKARSIGPAIMGGRVSEIAVDPLDPATFYVGYATSGVFKTTDAGATFAPLFDKQPVLSIGAVAVAPSDRRVVWVGTGEANDRNSSGWGDGVYRSTDGGATWTRAGLGISRTIARIVVDPRSPETAYAAAMGHLWQPGGERGLYRTTDGGKSWSRVLAAAAPDDAVTGCGDVALDPKNPDTLYAALYARQRKPWRFDYGPGATGGRDAGGIFKSTDGGATWRRLTNGLPPRTGRIGLAVYAKDPRIVYAVVQSDEGGTSGIDNAKSKAGGIFRSEDGGESWTRVNPLNPRAFYFSQVRIDPQDDRRIYVLGFMLHVSDDGGRTFREDLFKNVHADCHALAIVPPAPALVADAERAAAEARAKAEPGAPPPAPLFSRQLVLGTDGGAYQSFDAGASWAHLDRVAAAQYYRISVDDSAPYRICGGLQDNTNWVGPSQTNSQEGILNADWTEIGGGDGFYCVFDPFDRDLLYAEAQEGYLHRFNTRTGEHKDLRPEPTEGQPRYRFHWNSPLIGSRHEKGTMFLAGNVVFRVTDRGERFQVISPDLSANDPARTTTTGSGAENYGVVYALAESPRAPGMLWAGTDDGRLWRTRDGGASWTELTANLPAVLEGQWLTQIEPSWHDAETAYLAVAAYRFGSDAPLVFRTADGGKTWQDAAGDLPRHGPVRVVREDPKNPAVLYAGTEFGAFVSLDRGARWTRLGGLPPVIVDDLAIHPREHDLVIGTHGRSLWIVDDASPLAALTPEVAAKPLHLFAPQPAHGSYRLRGWVESNGGAVYRGENPPEGALLTAWVRELDAEPVKLTVTDASGRPVANLALPGTPGLNRVAWDLRPTKDLLTEYGGEGTRKLVPPGVYTVTVTRGTERSTQPLTVTIAEGIETR